MWSYVAAPIIVGMFALAAAAVGIRGTSIGQHIGAAFFIGGSSGIATAFIVSYFRESYLAGGTLSGIMLSTLATWVIAYLLVNLIYVADNRQATTMATIVSVFFGIGALIYILSSP